MPYNVFLSYSWSNSAERRVLADKIGAIENVKVLVDDDFISPGDPIHSTVLKMIDAADCLVVLLTREGLQSREVWDEITRAHDRNKVIIPILAEGTKLEEIPWHFRDLRRVSYDLKNFDFVVERVIAAIWKRANPSNIFESPHPATLRMFFSFSLLYWVVTGPWPLVWLFLTSDRNARVCWDIATTFPHLYLHSTCVGLWLVLCLRFPLGTLFTSVRFRKAMWTTLFVLLVLALVFILHDVSIGPELYGTDPSGIWLPLSSALQMLVFMLSAAVALLIAFGIITHFSQRTADITVTNRLFGAILYGVLWLPLRSAYEAQTNPSAIEPLHATSHLRFLTVIFIFILGGALSAFGVFYKQRRYLVPLVVAGTSSAVVSVALLLPNLCVSLFGKRADPLIYLSLFALGFVCYKGLTLYEGKKTG